MKACRYAKQYKAKQPPRCGGDAGPCEVCLKKWAAAGRIYENRKKGIRAIPCRT